jgi:tetratricopeptide (TPR) repeat protein
MSNRWALLFVLMHIAGFSGAATAQTLDQQRCAAPDPDVAILSCTAIIQSGHETQQNLANTYTRRGTAYARKGQNDLAIEDFDEAIRINPNRADAFNNRGLAKRAKGDSAGGDADIAKAKQLTPNVAPALADSKSSAENCLAAIDGLAKVAVIAQENNWITTTLATGGCLVTFPGKNVKRDEFFNLISASVDLTFMSDTRLPQQRGEWYEIKSDRTNKLVLNIMSQSDGTLIAAGVSEMPRFAPRQVASPEVDRAPALADSKSSAEFTLTTCLAAMDDLAKVEVMARENNWTNKTPPISAAISKIANSLSTWEVTQGDDKFTVTIWVDVSGTPRKVCAAHFPGKVKREDFLNLISASVELTFMSDTRFPQRRSETYEIKRNRSDRTNKLMLSIMSQSDGTLMNAMVSEVFAWQIAPGDR